MEKPDTISTSFRLPASTVDQIEELSKLLKESKTSVVSLAVQRLYNDRQAVVKQDYENRIGKSGQ